MVTDIHRTPVLDFPVGTYIYIEYGTMRCAIMTYPILFGTHCKTNGLTIRSPRAANSITHAIRKLDIEIDKRNMTSPPPIQAAPERFSW